ncbi:MAG: chemotaxis protein CheW [Micavibrio aeruginosavorus]|uniref:Chemotaxis protein CheW n=1 Tax=Micavibrio aeruginosavorus TaxID=349221 RepID=A0A2W5N3F7_9BACT|nr:MAG: chemotaxis protein CheW [Micavibrio aeruginosavorus]
MSLSAIEKTTTDAGPTRDYLTITIADQIFGIPILQVQDVLGQQKVTKIPLAPRAVAGSLNLRGRIVTAIDVRACLGLPPRIKEGNTQEMSVVVENQGELYSLMIDRVGDVMSLSQRDYENNPSTLDPQWRSVCQGIYRLKGKLLVVLDVPRLLEGLES